MSDINGNFLIPEALADVYSSDYEIVIGKNLTNTGLTETIIMINGKTYNHTGTLYPISRIFDEIYSDIGEEDVWVLAYDEKRVQLTYPGVVYVVEVGSLDTLESIMLYLTKCIKLISSRDKF
jgi:hypothetical protein